MTQQTQTVPYVAVDHASAWRASERNRDSFVIQLQQHHLEAFDRALKVVFEDDA